MAFRIAESVRENLRHEHGDDTEEIGRADAHPDEREHVETAVDHRLDATHEEWPTGPENDRCPQSEFDPQRRTLAEDVADETEPNKGAHRQHKKRNRQHGADPKPALEIDKLGIRSVIGGWNPHRLQRHAADRTFSRFVPHDLGMHRAGIFRALRRCFGLVLAGEIMLRVGRELIVALLRTKVIGLTLVLSARLVLIHLHRHSANRISGRHSLDRSCCTVRAMAVIVIIVLVHWLVPAFRFD